MPASPKLLAPAAWLLAACAANAQPLAMKQEDSGVRWLCGGVGAEERREIAQLAKQANLELLFVSQKRGGYLADVDVALYREGTRTPALDVTARGPLCIVQAPAGAYRIEVAWSGVKRTARAVLPAVPSRPAIGNARLVFSFPAEAWDGISASPEEKRQAREP